MLESSNSIKLSAVVITYNEEEKIGKCIDSLIGVADEIIVVDSLSTDRTVEICKSKGATVISQPFLGYAGQKNFGIEHTNFNYILSLDADEVLSPELINSIKSLKANSNNTAFEFTRLTNYCGKWIKHGHWYPDVKLRLWNASKGKWGGKNPHDTYLLNEGSTQTKLKGDLLHYSYYSIEEHMTQAHKFSKIAAKAYHEAGKKSSWFKIIFSPISRLISSYLFNLGFLDGKEGWIIAKITYWETKQKYLLLKNYDS